MLSLPIGIRTVGVNETLILNECCRHMLATKIWDDEVFEEVREAELRILAFMGNDENPVGFASIRPNGDPQKRWNGHMWFDHLIKFPGVKDVEVTSLLYKERLKYAWMQPQSRKIFCVPFSEAVINYVTQTGWKRVRPPAIDAPNGIFKLSR